MLSGSELVKEDARLAIASFAEFRARDGPEDEVAEKNVQEICETLKNAWWSVLHNFRGSLRCRGIPGSEKILEHISNKGARSLDSMVFEINDDLKLIGSKISMLGESIHRDSHGIIQQFPGIQFDDHDPDPSRTFDSLSNPLTSPFISPGKILNMFKEHWRKHFDYGVSLMTQKGKDIQWVLSWQENLTHLSQRQVWHLQDLRDGSGLGFTVELFLIAFKQLLSTSSSQDSHSALYIRTFRTITSDWREYKHSLGTQKILLDAVASDRGIIDEFSYPAYITDELLVLLGNVLEGQSGPHIENAVQQLSITRPDDRPGIREFRSKALRVISWSQVSSSSP